MLPDAVTQDIKETYTPWLSVNEISNFNSFIRDGEMGGVWQRGRQWQLGRFGATARRLVTMPGIFPPVLLTISASVIPAKGHTTAWHHCKNSTDVTSP